MNPKKRIKSLVIAGLLLIVPLAGVAETITLPDGEVMEGKGEIVKGKVTIAYPDGRVMEGKIVNGKKHGYWTITFPQFPDKGIFS